MAVGPAVVLHGPQDGMPSPEALVDHLVSRWGHLPPHHRAAIADMYTAAPRCQGTGNRESPVGSSSSPAAAPSPSPSPPSVEGQRGSGTAAPASVGSATDGVDVRAVVSYNAYGDEYEDLIAADLRSSASDGGGGAAAAASDAAAPAGDAAAAAAAPSGVRSCVGLWPHFSSLNHACAPNCVHYVVGSTMVVRAVQAIPAGAELLISYLGRDDLAPRQVRQAVLRSRYGFTCDCARCRTEATLPDDVAVLLQQLYDRARHELAPRFERLAAAAAAEAEAVAAGREVPEAAEGGEDDDGDEDEDGDGESGAGAAAAAPSSMTAAEAAKRVLRKSGSSPAHWGAQLAALEPRLEECAAQLHAALRELQEDDEALEDEPAPSASSTSSASSSSSNTEATTNTQTSKQVNPTTASEAGAEAEAGAEPGRHLTRVQSAQAAAYQLLELLHLHAELTAAAVMGGGGGGGRGAAAAAAAASALGACWHVLDAVSRGSELQVFQACKLLQDALRQAPPPRRAKGGRQQQQQQQQQQAAAREAPEAVREAAGLLGQSLAARYGRLRGPQLHSLTQAAMRASRGFF